MLTFLGLAMAFNFVSTSDLRAEFPVSPRDSVIVRDAINRWTKKNNSKSAMDNRIPMVFYISKQRCVVLQLRAAAVGGNPAYCYGLTKDVLVEAVDNVE